MGANAACGRYTRCIEGQAITLTSPDIKGGVAIANEQAFKGFGWHGR